MVWQKEDVEFYEKNNYAANHIDMFHFHGKCD
jgi:hypothetical protein